jgi:hypothetical protein
MELFLKMRELIETLRTRRQRWSREWFSEDFRRLVQEAQREPAWDPTRHFKIRWVVHRNNGVCHLWWGILWYFIFTSSKTASSMRSYSEKQGRFPSADISKWAHTNGGRQVYLQISPANRPIKTSHLRGIYKEIPRANQNFKMQRR